MFTAAYKVKFTSHNVPIAQNICKIRATIMAGISVNKYTIESIPDRPTIIANEIVLNFRNFVMRLAVLTEHESEKNLPWINGANASTK